jgi:hypothetical protein
MTRVRLPRRTYRFAILAAKVLPVAAFFLSLHAGPKML